MCAQILAHRRRKIHLPPHSTAFSPFSHSLLFPALPLAETTMTSIVDPALAPDDSGAAVSPEELRRLRRTISNRESARRCRLRKQRRLEELRELASVLRSQNRDHAGRLGGIARRCLLVHRDNDRLLAEASALGRRLVDLRRVLALPHLRLVAAPPPLAGEYYQQTWT
ncbi:hypothetical protein BHM03_00013364 [Ensete ventricosum]|nr:hypothetical protein BHM03_00013364 [Ensete ventricosum]